ncbi:MAG TPA: HlyD family type I secretion periplasmic adaptor subunit [Nitrospira sp.]|nr:HlyD family type I secretion periplasmic adaptor subunit [Nitrospira sp.]
MKRTSMMRWWQVWSAAWEAERRQPVAATPSRRSVEFLPAALEIQDAPPSPIGRAMLWTIMALFTVSVVWASVGRIDIVATAQGKIIPNGYSKIIQPYESGVITAIRVQDGQVVKQGDVLIELDPTQNQADRDRAFNEYRAAKVEAARLQALIAGVPTLVVPLKSDPGYVRLQQQLLHDQLAEYQARVDAAQHIITQRRAAIDATRENILRLEATVPMETERAGAFKRLMERDAVTKLDYLQAEGQRIDKLQELAGQQHKLRQDQAALAEAEKNRRALVSEFQQTKQAELSALETKAASLSQEVTKAGQKAELQRLVSPIDGVVQQLAVHTVGGVVTPAQPLLIVVPQDHPVEVEAQLENKDVGFVKEGQSAEIKVETFPFTLYGTIPGTVLTVSDDAVPVNKDKPADGLVFATRVSVARGTIPVEGKLVHLSPGMAVTVEIKTGRRRVIEYLLSPVLKSLHESLRER